MSNGPAASPQAPTYLRLSAGFIYFFFGFLKFFPDLSPAELIAAQSLMRLSLHWLDAATALWWLAVIECAIGLSFLLNVGLRWVFPLFLLHQGSTFIPLVILPELTFKIAPFAPTMEGQYILKNLISVAAGWAVMWPVVKASWRRDASGAAVADHEPPGNYIAMKTLWNYVAPALAVLCLVLGIALTYEKYRGSDLSRAPALGRSAMARELREAPRSGIAPEPNVLAADVASEPDEPAALPALEPQVEGLTLYPTIAKGMRTPFDVWRYYGRDASSFGSPILPMRFEQWLAFHRKQKPTLMDDVREYMNGRFDFSGEAIPDQFMSGGKPIMRGPVARLSQEVATFEELAELAPEEIKRRDVFPYKPLAHPLLSTAHMVFPQEWVKAHPEHARIDVDMDFPPEYLPEFPPDRKSRWRISMRSSTAC
jgi:hypothetical protein